MDDLIQEAGWEIARLAANNELKTADLMARLVDKLEVQRQETINEIINKYHKEMIKFYAKEQKTNPNIGNYAHEHDIKIHERMVKALEKQEWLSPTGENK